MKETSRFTPEYATKDDKFTNYALWPYEPALAFEGKLRSINLLFQSFEVAGADDSMFRLIRRIREAAGIGKTVYGVKQAGGGLKWELYFYDYERSRRQRSMSLVLDAIKPVAASRVVPNESLLYFMFSMDVDNALAAGKRDLEESAHVYRESGQRGFVGHLLFRHRKREQARESLLLFRCPKAAR